MDRPQNIETSVIIPCRDAAAHIASLLASLAIQDFVGSWEVILVDNGSSDDSVDVARSFFDRLPLRIYEADTKPNRAIARNLGASESRGRKLLFIDADDEVGGSYVREMVSALDSFECVGARLDIDTLNAPWSRLAHGPNWQLDELWSAHGFLLSAGPAIGIRRVLFEEIGGYRVNYKSGQDTVLSWEVQMSGRTIRFVKEAVYRYRYRSTPGALYRQSRDWGEASAQLFRDFRHLGMPRRPLGRSLRDVKSVLALMRLGRWRDPSRRANTAVVLGALVGRVRGSARHRVVYI